MTMRPLDILSGLSNQRVLVRLKNGVEVRGELKAFDVHINLVLYDAEIDEGDITRKFQKMFLRGDMVIYIS
ncbi:MAG: small nuclear ribonucleoprotein [Candidatus Altiarchaeales archaeon HGW-Altiarchaeales-3]|nr:MAG: small nuclear ribonucleoprotein [Candidatus Altiarchaeales archaeon HGW-Altiarchaeales-3]